MATTAEHRAARPLVLAGVILLAQAVVLAIWPAAHTAHDRPAGLPRGRRGRLRGAPLYDGGVLLDLPFVYPPFAALVFVPLTVLPLPVLKIAWTVIGVALLVFVVRRSAAVLGRRLDPAATALLVAVVLALDPVRTTFYLGQINVVLLALVLADLTGRPESRLRGVGVGIAAALKLTPLLFVAYLLLIGRWRAAATAVATFAAAVGLGFLLDPADSTVYWLRGTFTAADRISPVAGLSNHALAGLLARAGAPEEQQGSWRWCSSGSPASPWRCARTTGAASCSRSRCAGCSRRPTRRSRGRTTSSGSRRYWSCSRTTGSTATGARRWVSPRCSPSPSRGSPACPGRAWARSRRRG